MSVKDLLKSNALWAEGLMKKTPDFFSRLEKIQRPKYMWVGCADSRVPANQILGVSPGDVFVHRNVGNLVLHSDLNCLSVLQYAVEVLKIEDIIVCGHYNCGGVNAALSCDSLGLIDNWLRHIKDIRFYHREELNKISDAKLKQNRLAELNVRQQVLNVCHTTIVQDAWKRKQKLSVHGLIYSLGDGKLKELGVSIRSVADLDEVYQME